MELALNRNEIPDHLMQFFEPIPGLPAKNLVGIPERVSLSLQAEGWFLRSKFPWVKRTAMPESVTDRAASSLEYFFMLTKSPRYYFDFEAVKQKGSGLMGGACFGKVNQDGPGSRRLDDSENERIRSGTRNWRNGDLWFQSIEAPHGMVFCDDEIVGIDCNPQGTKDAHFATFGERLITPMLLAGCPEQVCVVCGRPRERIPEKNRVATRPGTNSKIKVPSGWDTKEGSHGTIHREGRTQEPEYKIYVPDPNKKQDALGDRTKVGFNQRWKDSLEVGNRDPERHVTETQTIGWTECGCAYGLEPDDLEIIESPTGKRSGDDPSLVTGRAGMNRPRGPEEGICYVTRYEQRMYAEQLKNSPHRAGMEKEAGEAFAHYIRTDRNGARPIRRDLWAEWVVRGWITLVKLPQKREGTYRPGRVLDPFGGSGTVGYVAAKLNRSYVLCEMNPTYVTDIAQYRLQEAETGVSVKEQRNGQLPLFPEYP